MKQVLAALIPPLLCTPAFGWDGELFVACSQDADAAGAAIALIAAPAQDTARVLVLAAGTWLLALHPDPVGAWREVVVQAGPDVFTYSGPQGWIASAHLCRPQ